MVKRTQLLVVIVVTTAIVLVLSPILLTLIGPVATFAAVALAVATNIRDHSLSLFSSAYGILAYGIHAGFIENTIGSIGVATQGVGYFTLGMGTLVAIFIDRRRGNK